MKVLYISGYPEDSIARHGVLAPGCFFLQKPFPPVLFLKKIREVLDSAGRGVGGAATAREACTTACKTRNTARKTRNTARETRNTARETRNTA